MAGTRGRSDGGIPRGSAWNARPTRRLTTHAQTSAWLFVLKRRIVIVTIASIVRLEASDNHVIVYADRPYRHRETLTDLCARLPAGTALRVHRSHAVNVAAVRELKPRPHGEYELLLRDGSVVMTGRHFRTQIEAAFGLLRAPCAA